jgi:predicted dehydrogenase
MRGRVSMRLGLAGAGEVAWRHAAAASELDGFTLTAVFDPATGRADRLAASFGARVARTFDELLPAADLVVLAVPHALHAPLALRAREAGVRVLVENSNRRRGRWPARWRHRPAGRWRRRRPPPCI